VGDLLLQHGRHQVLHRPHAFVDLGPAAQAAAQTGQHMVALAGLDPATALQITLVQHRAGAQALRNFSQVWGRAGQGWKSSMKPWATLYENRIKKPGMKTAAPASRNR